MACRALFRPRMSGLSEPLPARPGRVMVDTPEAVSYPRPSRAPPPSPTPSICVHGTAVAEQPCSFGAHPHAVSSCPPLIPPKCSASARHWCALSPPASYLNMAAFRFILLFSLLLGVALFAAPGQASANLVGRCAAHAKTCMNWRLQCTECEAVCKKASKLKGISAGRLRMTSLWKEDCHAYHPDNQRHPSAAGRRAT